MEEKGNYVTISSGGRHNATIKVHGAVKEIEGQGTTIDVVLVNGMPHEGHQYTVLASFRHNNFKSDFEEKGWMERVAAGVVDDGVKL
ncbi:hypothetical protein C5167_020076 [Papaver somniferum]|uniref:Uncharacterized protein n=1 Tax=Papaver somniferum TaxID=3469 RepID=A0A4Y7IW67_PAPSO|nr:hypothetical protein C5167_020076 [Papaver somniferum]